jgi:hypothetical protein
VQCLSVSSFTFVRTVSVCVSVGSLWRCLYWEGFCIGACRCLTGGGRCQGKGLLVPVPLCAQGMCVGDCVHTGLSVCVHMDVCG